MDTINYAITKGETKYAQLGIRIDADLLGQLSEQARKEERSMSSIVRLAVRNYIEKTNHIGIDPM